MYRVGITGGIGSGKSIICNIFKSLGIPVFTADIEASILINSDEKIAKQLIAKFGKDIYIYEGMINRKKLATVMFQDTKAMEFVNTIVHPSVMKEYNNWCKKQCTPYIIFETAILFESGISKSVDTIIAVSSPLPLRLNRIMKRDKITEHEIMARVNNQMADEEKQKRSQHIIYNDEQQLVIPQVIRLHNLFLTNKQ